MIKPKVIRLLAITLAGLASATLCRAVEPFNYYLTDWSVVALKDYQKGTRITPYTRLILAGNAEETGSSGSRVGEFGCFKGLRNEIKRAGGRAASQTARAPLRRRFV